MQSPKNTFKIGQTVSLQKRYPRVIEQHKRVQHLQDKLYLDGQREFTGLTKNQQDVLLHIVDRNGKIRKVAGFKEGAMEALEDDMYDMAHRDRAHPDGLEADTLEDEFPVEIYTMVQQQEELPTERRIGRIV